VKTQMLSSFACSIYLLGSVTLAASAQNVPTQRYGQPPAMRTQLQAVNQDITIPLSTAIVISFPQPLTVDVGQKQEYPFTVPLSQPIKDSQGNVLVPENTPVSIVLKPTKGGAKIVAKSLVVNGQIISIEASTQMIPGRTITHMRANDKARDNGSVWGRIAGSGAGLLGGGDPEAFDRGVMGGNFIGGIIGARTPENTRVVDIPQNGVYVLSLSAPIQLSAR
jgi:hypothetical protein